MEISKEFHFEASHILPKHKGKCSRLHGHSWVLTVYVKGGIDPDTGFVMDYADLKKSVQWVVNNLDHYHFGADTISHGPPTSILLPTDFYPSSENLIILIGSLLLSPEVNAPWSKLELNETCTSKCILTRDEYENIRNAERLESVSRKEP